MTWRDSLRPATFRGVKFFVETTETAGGRRVVEHKYPNRDGQYSEDLGLDADSFTVRAYCLGDDYLTTRDRLIAVLKKPGAGTLQLPTRAAISVIAKPFRVTFDNREGGIEYFELTFVEATGNKYPAQTLDTAAQVSLAASAANSSILQRASQLFKTTGVPGFVAASAAQNGMVLANQLRGLTSGQQLNNVTDFTNALDVFQGNMNSLVLSGNRYGGSVQSLVGRVAGLYNTPAQAYLALKSLLSYGSKFFTGLSRTRNRQIQNQNQAIQVSLVRRAALASMAETATAINFASYDDAVALRDELTGAMDDELLAIGDTDDDQGYLTLSDLRTQVSNDITSRAANLVRIRTVRNFSVRPALTVAYQQYGETSQTDDIIARNKVRHPAFVPAGELQILV